MYYSFVYLARDHLLRLVSTCILYAHGSFMFLLCFGKQESLSLSIYEPVSAFPHCHATASIQIWTQLRTGVLAGPVPCFSLLSLTRTPFQLWILWLC